MLAGLRGFDRPLAVQRVGQRDVDDVDVGVGEERFIAAVGLGNAFVIGIGSRFGRVAAGDCDEFAARGLANRVNQGVVDVGGGEQSPADLVRHGIPPEQVAIDRCPIVI